MVTLHDIGVVLVTIGVACIFAAAWHWVAEVFDDTPEITDDWSL